MSFEGSSIAWMKAGFEEVAREIGRICKFGNTASFSAAALGFSARSRMRGSSPSKSPTVC